MKKSVMLLICGLVLLLCGCRRSQFKDVAFEVYIPPTLVATAVNTPTVSPITPMPTSADHNCSPNLSYVDDVTVPDGTTFAPGDQIVKTWAVRNDGDCAWSPKYSLRLIDGSAMGAESRQELPSIEAGAEGEVTIVFTAPSTQGSYWSSWQAYNPQGQPFGDNIYIEIYVDPYHTISEDGETDAYGQNSYY